VHEREREGEREEERRGEKKKKKRQKLPFLAQAEERRESLKCTF
jgi:hypothetical protein